MNRPQRARSTQGQRCNELGEEDALDAVRRLDAGLKEQYETPLLDADVTEVDPSGPLGQTDDLRPNETPDSR